MCNSYRNDPTLTQWAEDFERHLGLSLHLSAGSDTLANQPWKTAVYPKYAGLFVRPLDPSNPTGPLEPAVGRWGLVPAHHAGPAKTWDRQTNNCRSETMWKLPAFRASYEAQRCVIPVTHFFEFTGPKGKMTRHAISRADGSPLFLAGLWARHDHQGERTDSYTMVMQGVADGDDMQPFHDRQPVVLDRATVGLWLDPKASDKLVVRSPLTGTLAFDPPQPAAA